MSIAQTNMIAKIAAVVAGLGLVAMSFASFAPAKAATTDLSAQIAALQAQLAALMAQAGGSSASASVTFTRDLTVGSTGSDVTALQNWLIGKGYGIAAGATGYFGAQTKAAVAAWQAASGITPAAGYFGPKSRAAVGAGASTGSTGGSTGTTGLTGGAGKLKNVDSLGDVETDLKEGDSATKVTGVEVTAQDSDIGVQRVDVTLTIGTTQTGSSASISKYLDTVALYQGSKKLASMSASAGDKSGRVWTYRFSDVNGVVKEGDTENFYVEVTPVSSIGSTEDGETITANIPNDGIRAVDAEGVSETYGSSLDNNQFTVSTATDGKATISEASDNPKSSTVKADVNNTTEDVVLESFNIKAKNQDITIHDLPVTVRTGSSHVNDTFQSIALVSNGKTLKTKTISSATTTQEVLFDTIDQSISKDDTQNFQVVATVRKIDAGGSNTFSSGDAASSTVDSAVGAWDVEDANGTSLTSTGSTLTGALVGNDVTFQATGITVTKVDASYTKTVGQNSGEGDKTQYSIKFKVTAGDDDLFIAGAIARGAATTNQINWGTTTSSGGAGIIAPGYTAANIAADDTNNGDLAGSYFKIPSGTTRSFTLNVTLTASSTGYTGVQLNGIGYGTTNALGTAYTSGLDTFKTADVSMTTH